MSIELLLTFILIFLIIIASQNYARGGMQENELSQISGCLYDIKRQLDRKFKVLPHPLDGYEKVVSPLHPGKCVLVPKDPNK